MTKRKRKPEDVIPTIYVRVTPELKAAVEARAQEERRTEKQIVTAALRLYLDEEVWAETYSEQLPSGRIHPVHQDILDRAKALLEDEP